MCLSVPAKVIEIEKNLATVELGGTKTKVSLDLVEDIKINDYVLVHTGFALQKIDEEEAERTLELFDEFEDFNQELDALEKEKNERII